MFSILYTLFAGYVAMLMPPYTLYYAAFAISLFQYRFSPSSPSYARFLHIEDVAAAFISRYCSRYFSISRRCIFFIDAADIAAYDYFAAIATMIMMMLSAFSIDFRAPLSLLLY